MYILSKITTWIKTIARKLNCMFYLKKQPEFYIKFEYLKQRCGNIGKTKLTAQPTHVLFDYVCVVSTVGISPDC